MKPKYSESEIEKLFVVVGNHNGARMLAARIPEVIRLADGREFDVRSLYRLVTKESNHSVTGQRRRPVQYRTSRYTAEERTWIIAADLQEIMERYGLDRKSSRALQVQSGFLARRDQIINGITEN